VTLYAPRPEAVKTADSLHGKLRRIDDMLTWVGPEVEVGSMPTLEIVHHGQGRATLVGASWGPEQLLRPENLELVLQKRRSKAEAKTKALANADADTFDAVHIAALSSARRQLEFAQYFRPGARSNTTKYKGLLSAGTYARAIGADKDAVLHLINCSDLFFMNSNEANLLFGDAAIELGEGQTIFVTDGDKGAKIYSATKTGTNTGTNEDHGPDDIEAEGANELDPTGAGDTFCGATLAGLVGGLGAVQSAKLGATLAARVIEQAGSNYYFPSTS